MTITDKLYAYARALQTMHVRKHYVMRILAACNDNGVG